MPLIPQYRAIQGTASKSAGEAKFRHHYDCSIASVNAQEGSMSSAFQQRFIIVARGQAKVR